MCIPIDESPAGLKQVIDFIGADDLWVEAGGKCSVYSWSQLLRALIYIVPAG